MLPTTTYYFISRSASKMTPTMLISAIIVGIVLAGALIGFVHWFLNR